MEQLVVVMNEQVVVSSRQVAESFEKEHKHVLDSINGLKDSMSTAEFSALFFESEYKASNGKSNPEYLMNRDGFSLLAMGFTGKKALGWKLKYIEAFNAMEEKLRRPMTLEETLALSDKLLYERMNKLEQQLQLVEFQRQSDRRASDQFSDLTSQFVLNHEERICNLEEGRRVSPREALKNLVKKIARSSVDMDIAPNELYRNIYASLYETIQTRSGINLALRSRNRYNRLIRQGETRTRAEELSKPISIIDSTPELWPTVWQIIREESEDRGFES